MPKIYKNLILIALVLTASFLLNHAPVSADRTTDLQKEIDARNVEIRQLQAEIKQYQDKISVAQKQSTSLKSEIAQIDLMRQKLATDIKLTNTKIAEVNALIKELAVEIGEKQNNIGGDQEAVREAIRALNEADHRSFIELVVSAESLSDFLTSTDQYSTLQDSLVSHIYNLRNDKVQLEGKKGQQEGQKHNLASLQSELADQKKVADSTKAAKDAILTQTKNQQSAYEKLVADRQKKVVQIELEMEHFEEELKSAVKPGTLPSSGSVLAWPLDHIVITQYFGNTEFSTQNPQVYNGKGHNGIDLGIPVGTPVKAAMSGTIIGTGDTDITCPHASYGKWVLIRHPNGLSTLYAHLSLIKVAEGQSVTTGQIVGYSGLTGYTTGPHLHFTVYATAGVQVSSLQSKVAGCGVYRLPVAPYDSYLNPLSYLPK